MAGTAVRSRTRRHGGTGGAPPGTRPGTRTTTGWRRRDRGATVAVTVAALLCLGTWPAADALGLVGRAAATTAPDGTRVRVLDVDAPSTGTVDGVTMSGGFGSAIAASPTADDEFYGLTDRGPNVDTPDGTGKIALQPGFAPAIGLFRRDGGTATLVRRIELTDAAGTPLDGLASLDNPSGATLVDAQGRELPAGYGGIDPEGLVALPDGTFWVSDEYGPVIAHFDADGRLITWLSAADGSLPAELAHRATNRGLEGLTVTPDGSTLVAVMQGALANGVDEEAAADQPVVRIVTVDLVTGARYEYLYLLSGTTTGVSDVTALDDGSLLVLERGDTSTGPGGSAQLRRVDLAGATDVGPGSTVAGAVYRDRADGGTGLEVGGRTLEQLLDGLGTAGARGALAAAGITPVTAEPYLDLDALLLQVDPSGATFRHDKVEGVAVLDGGEILLSDDDDFGVGGAAGSGPGGLSAPFTALAASRSDGGSETAEVLVVDPAD